MIAHLIAATLTAAIAMILALLLRRRSAGLRHATLLAALVGFTVPTPWLDHAGGLLATRLSVTPRTPSFLDFEFSSVKAPLTETPAKRGDPSTPRNILLLVWASVFARSLAVWLRRLLRTVPVAREASPAEIEVLHRAQAALSFDSPVNLAVTNAGVSP